MWGILKCICLMMFALSEFDKQSLTKEGNSIKILTVLDSREGEVMDYTELAKQFLSDSYLFRKQSQQKKIDESMQGEAFAILYVLRQGGSVLPSEISTVMNITSARVAAVLNSLEDKGLITREIDSSDRRKILINLTEEGKALAEKRYQMAVNSTVRLLKILGEDDARELVRITGRLAELAPKISNSE